MNRDAYGSFELNLSQETWPVCSQSEQSNAAPRWRGEDEKADDVLVVLARVKGIEPSS
jgi:hypothetical protein